MRSLLLAAATLIAFAVSDAAQAATVSKVIDGDTLRVKDGKRTRTVDLRGLDAPEPTACYGPQATKELQRLAPRGTKVHIKNGAVYRNKTNVNAALVRAGAATASDNRLAAAEQQAKTNARGLWKACAATPPPLQPDPKQRAFNDIKGRVFIRITTTTFSSSESRLNMCSDGTFVEDVSTTSELGADTAARYTGRWEVLSATYTDASAQADVRRLNDDGTIGFVSFQATPSAVTVNGNQVQVAASGVCS